MTVVLAHRPGDTSGPALDAALQQATLLGTDLVIVNVAPGDAPIDARIAPLSELDRMVDAASGAGVAATVEQPVDDDVAGAIVDVTERHGADLVVIGVRRRSPVGKLLLGSIAQRVMLEAECPVLGVKAPRTA